MSTTFSVTRDQIIQSALRLQGWLDYQAPAPDATKVSQMNEALNIMLKAWAANEVKIWCVEELLIPMVNSKYVYTIGPTGADFTANRPLRVVAAFLRNQPVGATSFSDIQLQALAKADYLLLGNKASIGVPNSYYYDKQLPNGVLNLYNVPGSDFANYTAHIFSQRQIQDVINPTDTFDLPQEWYQALRWGLADETAVENKTPADKADKIERKAAMYRDQLQDWDQEDEPLQIVPDSRYAYEGFPGG